MKSQGPTHFRIEEDRSTSVLLPLSSSSSSSSSSSISIDITTHSRGRLTANRPMEENYRHVLDLAERGEWEEVLELLEQHSELAKAQDDFGMLPLHWACTEPTILLDVIQTLLRVYPEACQLQNLSGMLPLHVAIANKIPGLHINALLMAYPEAAFTKDGNGRYPIELAMANNLPKFTTDLIRKAGAHAVRSASTFTMERSTSFDDVNSVTSDRVDGDLAKVSLTKSQSIGSLMASRQASEYARLLDDKLKTPVEPIDSTQISTQLKELLSQLQQLSADIRSSSSMSGTSTYRSSFSSSSSGNTSYHNNGQAPTSVLWNPSDKLGFVLEAYNKDIGARIRKFSSKSDVLGVESLNEGDVLVSINGTSVVGTPYASIMRFLKHLKMTCTLCFSKGPLMPESSSLSSYGSNSQLVDQDSLLYTKVAEMLDMTFKKVSAVEETVRLSSAMSFCA